MELKIQCPRGRAGSTPAAGTKFKLEMLLNGSLSNRVDETILVKELSSVRLLNSFFSCWSK